MIAKYKKRVYVFVVSDATGMTAERVIRAALVQFSEIEPRFKKFTFVRERERIREILDSAERLEAMVIYSLASLKTRKWLRAESRTRSVYTIDLLGPPLKLMEKLWNVVPDFRPGILGGPNGETMRLAESIDFTLKHDDGQNIQSIDQAELIILGISRTSKTPTSLFISCNFNLKVANFPIILGTKYPKRYVLHPHGRLDSPSHRNGRRTSAVADSNTPVKSAIRIWSTSKKNCDTPIKSSADLADCTWSMSPTFPLKRSPMISWKVSPTPELRAGNLLTHKYSDDFEA